MGFHKTVNFDGRTKACSPVGPGRATREGKPVRSPTSTTPAAGDRFAVLYSVAIRLAISSLVVTPPHVRAVMISTECAATKQAVIRAMPTPSVVECGRRPGRGPSLDEGQQLHRVFPAHDMCGARTAPHAGIIQDDARARVALCPACMQWGLDVVAQGAQSPVPNTDAVLGGGRAVVHKTTKYRDNSLAVGMPWIHARRVSVAVVVAVFHHHSRTYSIATAGGLISDTLKDRMRANGRLCMLRTWISFYVATVWTVASPRGRPLFRA